MGEFIERYINPFTDFGFKRLFGEEPNKELLLDFLKEEQGEIKDLTYRKSENLGSSEIDREAIFDLYCENGKGEKFIVELQKSKQNFFKDRTVYYSTFAIREQAKQADCSFELKPFIPLGSLILFLMRTKMITTNFDTILSLPTLKPKKSFMTS